MRLYNTLTRREEDFAPSRDNVVRMYTCGLTVYARGHIGNFRTFVSLDVLRRALKHEAGYGVRQVMNFTDVDDRTILESKKAGVPLREYTSRYIDLFRQDAAALGLEPVEENPRATDPENLAAMADTIKALEQNGHTYTSDGSIYFKISTFPDYGKLAHLDHSGIKSGARIDSDKYEKEDARDFVLWKATKEGEPNLGFGHRSRTSRLAHRVLGDGAAPAGPFAHRHPRRRRRPDLSAPRERDCAERRGDAPAVLALLGSRRAPDDRGRRGRGRGGEPASGEDVEVARQRLQPAGHRRARLSPVGASVSVSRGPLSKAAEVFVDRHGAGGRGAEAPDRFSRPPRLAARARSRIPRSRKGSRRRSTDSLLTSRTM